MKMTKQLRSRVSKTRTFSMNEKGIKDAERFQKRLYSNWDKVHVEPQGFNSVRIWGENKEE